MTQALNDSYRCNGDHIRYLRKRAGLSQSALSTKTGYCERVISKAEANGRIASVTLVDLAQALSTMQEQVLPEQLIYDPVSVAKSITHATYILQRNMFSRMQHTITEDFVLEAIGDADRFPFVGTYYGPKGFEIAIDRFFSYMEVPATVDHKKWYEYFNDPDNEDLVVVWGQSWIHPIGKPLSKPLDVTQRVEFRDGKVCRFVNRYDASDPLVNAVPSKPR